MPFQAIANLCKVASDDPFIRVRYRAKGCHVPESEHLQFICWDLPIAPGYQWNPQNTNMALSNTYSNAKMGEQGFSTTLPHQWTVYLLWLREDNDWHCPSVNTLHSWWHACLRDSLDSVSPSFIFQMPVDILSWNMSSSMMQASWRDKECVTNTAEKHCSVLVESLQNCCTYLSRCIVHNVKGPAFVVSVALVHLKHFFSELLADVP